MKAIETRGLTKYYGKTRGIENVELSVEEGDFFGFIGPNGAGKSTLIRTALGLLKATEGSVKVFGHDVWEKRSDVLSRVGYLPSEISFYSGMRVKEIIEFSASLRGKSCETKARELAERLDLDVSRKAGELSLGNRKKVGIVCALQHEPDLYVLDEPTSGLDPLVQREFYSILKERNEKGATVFLSSHVLSEVERFCKHAAVIKDGRLLACDSVEGLSHTGAKRVTVKGIKTFAEFENIRDIKYSDGNVTFLYSGEAPRLVRELSAFAFDDISITDPELDEVFMHYYAREDR